MRTILIVGGGYAEHAATLRTGERTLRVLAVWATAVRFGGDIVALTSVRHPRDAFLAATRPAADARRS